MRYFLTELVICTVSMSLIALVFYALSPLLAKRYRAKSLYYTWLVIAIGFLVPFRPSLDFLRLPDQFSAVQPFVSRPAAIIKNITDAASGTQWQNFQINIPVNSAQTAPQSSAPVPIMEMIFLLWAAGVVFSIVSRLFQHRRFLRAVKRWSSPVTEERILSVFQEARLETGVPRWVGIRICPFAASPMLIGFLHPTILLPTADYRETELTLILKHELVHWKRRDLWIKSLALLASAVHWFNPVMLLVEKSMAQQCELSCDAEAMRDSDGDARKQYGMVILGAVRGRSGLQTALSTNFYGGKQAMRKRLSGILDTTKKKAGSIVLCGALIVSLGAGAAFAADDVSAEAKLVPDNSTVSQQTAGDSELRPNDLPTEQANTASVPGELPEGIGEVKVINEAPLLAKDQGWTFVDALSGLPAGHTAQEYKAQIEHLKQTLPALIGKADWTVKVQNFVWSQAYVDAAVTEAEGLLKRTESGAAVKTTGAGCIDIFGLYGGDSADADSQAGNFIYVTDGTKTYELAANTDNAKEVVSAFCRSQTASGAMTQAQADHLLSVL